MANGFLSTGPTRSDLIANLLREGQRQFPQQIQSVGEGVARTGSRLVDAFMQKRAIDEELARRQATQGADTAALQTALAGAPAFQNPDFDPTAIDGAQPVTSVIPGQEGQVLGMGAAPDQQTLVDAIAGGTPEAFSAAIGTEDISPQLQQNLAFQALQGQQQRVQSEADARAAAKKAEDDAAKLRFDQSGALRDDFTKLSGDFISVQDAFNRVEASSEDPSAAGDLALIFNYMKILDPGSTVREGEFATAQNSAGIPDRLRAQYNTVISGQRLAEDQRNDFVDRAGRLFDRQLATHNTLRDQFSSIAERFELSPDDVLVDFRRPEEPLPQGTIDNGDGTFTLADGRVIRRK